MDFVIGLVTGFLAGVTLSMIAVTQRLAAQIEKEAKKIKAMIDRER